MRAWLISVLLLSGLVTAGRCETSGKIIKVLPSFLDKEGRHSISPSLYDRDAYQANLRRNPKERSGLRFDIQWRARGTGDVRLVVEMRGEKGKDKTHATVESSLPRSGTSKWTKLTFAGEDYQKFGELHAWRVTLWDGDSLLGETKSFLW